MLASLSISAQRGLPVPTLAAARRYAPARNVDIGHLASVNGSMIVLLLPPAIPECRRHRVMDRHDGADLGAVAATATN
jgi:hypothetical protein